MNEYPGTLPGADAPGSSFYSSPAYNEAVNASRFVKGFGITALIYALAILTGIALLGGGIGVGVGLFILRYDSDLYYRLLGSAVIVSAIGAFIVPLGVFIGPVMLSGAVAFKGMQVLGVLSKEGQSDEEWKPSRKRAIIGTIASTVGLAVSLLILLVAIIGVIAVLSGKIKVN